MIPSFDDSILSNSSEENVPSLDFAMDTKNNKINGMVDELEAVKQAIYIILNTERYDHLIYSWDYGVEFSDLVGKGFEYVETEIESRVSDALLQDDRIQSVTNFEFSRNKNILTATFKVNTIYGTTEEEVSINV